jgi:hypothetical protein
MKLLPIDRAAAVVRRRGVDYHAVSRTVGETTHESYDKGHHDGSDTSGLSVHHFYTSVLGS